MKSIQLLEYAAQKRIISPIFQKAYLTIFQFPIYSTLNIFYDYSIIINNSTLLPLYNSEIFYPVKPIFFQMISESGGSHINSI
jgi:hypothetical protein